MADAINIFDEQEIVKVSDDIVNTIKNAVRQSLDYEKFNKDVEVNILLVDNYDIRTINRENRDIDAETDVLSFPMLEFDDNHNIKSDEGDFDFDEDKLLLGDIVLSLEKAAMQADEYGHEFLREVGYLTVHSCLHLLGYDHIDDDDRKVMRFKEEEILKKINLTRQEN